LMNVLLTLVQDVWRSALEVPYPIAVRFSTIL
jgi:hypothetical protein